MNVQDPQRKSPMRSLFIDDIPGTRPVKRVFDKSSFSARHNEQIYRFGRNPEERVIDWYQPTRKVVQPLDKNGDQQWITKRTLQNSFKIHTQEMSNSMPIKQLIEKEGLNSSSLMTRSSILGGSGLQSLRKAEDNPYFPHRYVDPKMGESNKWSGQRSWMEQPTEYVKVASTKDSYFRKWD